MADGVPYHIGVSHGAAPTRITYYNKDDAANTFAWNFNQLTKPDSGFVYRWDLLNQEGQGIGPLYSDVFRVRAYNNTAPFSALPGQGRSRYPVWNAYATDPSGTVQRAAILSFLIESHTGSVGAAMDMTTASTMDPWGQPLPAGAVEAPFTDKFNLQWVGIAGDNLDHSAEFNWNIQKMHDFYSLFIEDL